MLGLYLDDEHGPNSDILNRNQGYDAIFDIMRHPTIQSLTIRGLSSFSNGSSLLSRDYDFRHLDISLGELKDDIFGVQHLISKAPNLSSLVADNSGCRNDQLLAFYNGIADRQNFSIMFKEQNLCIPSPPRGSSQSKSAYRHLQDLMKDHFNGASELLLDVDKLDDSTVIALTKAVEDSLRFNVLKMKRANQLGDPFVENLDGRRQKAHAHSGVDSMETPPRVGS